MALALLFVLGLESDPAPNAPSIAPSTTAATLAAVGRLEAQTRCCDAPLPFRKRTAAPASLRSAAASNFSVCRCRRSERGGLEARDAMQQRELRGFPVISPES